MKIVSLFYLLSLLLVFQAASCEKKNQQVETQTSIKEKDEVKAANQTLSKVEDNFESLKPEIVSRQQWKAKKSVGEAKEHKIRYITFHHTASAQKKDVSIEKKMTVLQNFSQHESRLDSGKIKPAWFDIPYHFYIASDGKIAEGRETNFVGDTNTDYNPEGHALIVLEGNFEIEQPTTEQTESLAKLAAWLADSYKIPVSEIKVHNDYASTACPGKNFKKMMPTIQQKIGEILKIANKSQTN